MDEIRNLEQTLYLAAPGGACKVGVIVEADRMNDQAANAFLKTLEEPPQNTLLLLLTANPQRLLPTILSRCVRIPLLGGDALLENGGAELVAALNHAASRGFGSPVAALHLKATFAAFLARSREAAEAAAKAAEKEEISAYKDATDGTWLKEREAFHEAAAKAEYLDARSRLFDVLMAWMADLLRLKVKAAGLDFPDSAQALRRIAEAEPETRLLQRMAALDSLRRTLETNAKPSADAAANCGWDLQSQSVFGTSCPKVFSQISRRRPPSPVISLPPRCLKSVRNPIPSSAPCSSASISTRAKPMRPSPCC